MREKYRVLRKRNQTCWGKASQGKHCLNYYPKIWTVSPEHSWGEATEGKQPTNSTEENHNLEEQWACLTQLISRGHRELGSHPERWPGGTQLVSPHTSAEE